MYVSLSPAGILLPLSVQHSQFTAELLSYARYCIIVMEYDRFVHHEKNAYIYTLNYK